MGRLDLTGVSSTLLWMNPVFCLSSPKLTLYFISQRMIRVVNMPGMEDEPTKTFTNLSVLFSKLGISEVDGEGEGGEGEEEEAYGHVSTFVVLYLLPSQRMFHKPHNPQLHNRSS